MIELPISFRIEKFPRLQSMAEIADVEVVALFYEYQFDGDMTELLFKYADLNKIDEGHWPQMRRSLRSTLRKELDDGPR